MERKPQTLAAIRAQCCTIQQYFLHFAQLGETLKRFGLMDSTGFITNPDNVIHSYECPNIINGIRNVNGGKIIGGSGGSATTIVGEEHADNVSLMATCGLDGHKYNPQLNYAQKTLDPGMFPTNSTTLYDCLVFVTEKGTHTKDSFYEFSKWIIQAV